jgi:prepilin signal peptidase PulO-like enzyme (type II secretory pathway)
MLLPPLLVALIGLIAGGLINLLSDDLPHHRMPRAPRYPDEMPRPPIAWLGLFAFLTGKRASPNGAKLSWRYPITEISTIILMLLALHISQFDPDMDMLHLVLWLIYMAVFVLITVIDLEHKLILFSVMIPSYVLGLVDALFTPAGPSLTDALIGAAAGFGVFFLIYVGGFLFVNVLSKMRRQEINEVAFGYGDVMLITFSGLILGWQPLIFTIFLTVFLGAAGAILYLAVRMLASNRYSMFTALPYGPYIVIGTLLLLLFPAQIAALLGTG